MGVGWKAAGASVIGSRHVVDGKPCEDAYAIRIIEARGQQFTVLAVSDGAGSSACAQAGSDLTVNAFCEFVAADLRDYRAPPFDRPQVQAWIDNVGRAVKFLAWQTERPVRDYSATLLAAVISNSGAVYVQIGDGAIVVPGDEPGVWGWMFEPHRGEYANQTSFVTDADAAEKASIEIATQAPEEIAIFSDGLEKLLIQEGPTRSVVGAFFESMMPPVRKLGAPGRDPELSVMLADYLGAERINARTDDDKTLILASRRTLAAAAPVVAEAVR